MIITIFLSAVASGFSIAVYEICFYFGWQRWKCLLAQIVISLPICVIGFWLIKTFTNWY